jgi:hypothetical protein
MASSLSLGGALGQVWRDRTYRALLVINLVMPLAVAIHDLDHLRQAAQVHYSPPLYLTLTVTAQYLLNVVALLLVLRRSRFAAWWTIVVGVVTGGLFTYVHLIGAGSFWGYWATTYPDLNIDTLSWVLFVVPIVAGLAGILVAVQALRSAPETGHTG